MLFRSKVIEIFDSALPSTQKELKQLGLIDNPDILLDIEYVNGKTNVIKYDGMHSFIAIHGLKKITTEDDKRTISDIPYNKEAMSSFIKKMGKISAEYGFKTIGKIGVKFDKEPNLDRRLSERMTLNGKRKTLGDWLKQVKIVKPMITKEQFIEIGRAHV